MSSVSIATGMTLRPTSVQTATNENYVSALTATSGQLHKRDVSEELVKRYGDQGITGLLELMGAKAPTTQTTFEHYEEAFLHNDLIFQFDSSVSAAGVVSEAITVQSSSLHNSKSALRIGDILLLEDGTQCYVQAKSTQTAAVIFPLTSSGFVSAFSTGVDVNAVIIGNAFPEGSAQPEGLTPRIHEYSNQVQIIKESFEVTGSEATNVVYVKVDNQEMGSGYLWYLKGEADTYKRFMDYAEIQMVLGQDMSNTTLVAAGNSVSLDGSSYTLDTLRGTEGLLPFIENKGQSMDLGASAITMADFDAIVKSLDKFRGAKENALYAGINLSLDVDDLLAAQGAYAAGGANYGTFQNDKDMALNLGFNSFTRGGYTFHKKTYDLFNHPKLLGATGQKYNGYGMIIPMDTQKDARSGEMIPSLRIRYKAANGYSRDMEHWLTGSAVLQNKTNTEDVLKSHYRCERGFEGFAPNRYMLIKKS
jgi:hypothetical protein